MTPAQLEIGALALIVGMLGLAQRLGDWRNRPLARCLGIAASALFGAWCFLILTAPLAWGVAAVVGVIDLWFLIRWVGGADSDTPPVLPQPTILPGGRAIHSCTLKHLAKILRTYTTDQANRLLLGRGGAVVYIAARFENNTSRSNRQRWP